METLHSLEELTAKFNVARINTISARLEMDQIGELNQAQLRRTWASKEGRADLVRQCRNLVRATFGDNVEPELLTESALEGYIEWALHRIQSTLDIVRPELKFLWQRPADFNDYEFRLNKKETQDIIEIFTSFTEFKTLQKEIRQFCKSSNLKFPTVMTELRVMLTGLTEGPSVKEIIEVLGKEEALQRLKMFE